MSLSQQCAPLVAPQTMAAIVKTESKFYPLAIGINGNVKLARQPQNKAEAVVIAKWLLEKGYNIDLGLGQINSSNFRKLNLSVEDALEPCVNLAASSKILNWNYKSARATMRNEKMALHAAISAYNTGSFTKGFKNGYVKHVLNNATIAELTTSVPTIPPIELVPINSKKTPKTSVVKTPVITNEMPKETTSELGVKLTPENPSNTSNQVNEEPEKNINVYQKINKSVMVY